MVLGSGYVVVCGNWHFTRKLPRAPGVLGRCREILLGVVSACRCFGLVGKAKRQLPRGRETSEHLSKVGD